MPCPKKYALDRAMRSDDPLSGAGTFSVCWVAPALGAWLDAHRLGAHRLGAAGSADPLRCSGRILLVCMAGLGCLQARAAANEAPKRDLQRPHWASLRRVPSSCLSC